MQKSGAIRLGGTHLPAPQSTWTPQGAQPRHKHSIHSTGEARNGQQVVASAAGRLRERTATSDVPLPSHAFRRGEFTGSPSKYSSQINNVPSGGRRAPAPSTTPARGAPTPTPSDGKHEPQARPSPSGMSERIAACEKKHVERQEQLQVRLDQLKQRRAVTAACMAPLSGGGAAATTTTTSAPTSSEPQLEGPRFTLNSSSSSPALSGRTFGSNRGSNLVELQEAAGAGTGAAANAGASAVTKPSGGTSSSGTAGSSSGNSSSASIDSNSSSSSSSSSSNPATALHAAPHDPEAARYWETRLLSRACSSLAFHISSHFHIPTGPTDHLAPALVSTASTTSAGGSSSSSSSSNSADPAASLLNFSLPPLPPPPPLSADTGSSSSGAGFDPNGLYDNLPTVYALRAVASALVDPALWRATGLQPQPAAMPAAAAGAAGEGEGAPSHADAAQQQSLRISGSSSSSSSSNGSSNGSGNGSSSSAAERAFLGGAPPAINALTHVAAGALLRLSHACGHAGCYSLIEPLTAEAAAAAASSAPSAAPGTASHPGEGPQQPQHSAQALLQPLPGVPFQGRQLARLYDMARTAHDVHVGALGAVPAATAAALLVLLAASQPHTPAHPSLAPGLVAPTGNPTIPAALLGRYLRIGSRSRSVLDTVRVMWALLRLQLPGSGALLLPLSPGDDDGSSSGGGSSSEGEEDEPPAATASSSTAVTGAAAGSSSSSTGSSSSSGSGRRSRAAAAADRDPMHQLARILQRQLRNRERCLAALTAARPGELFGTWQMAVQALALLKDRLLVSQRSVAALEQLDDALAALEAALTPAATATSTSAAAAATPAAAPATPAPAAVTATGPAGREQQGASTSSARRGGGVALASAASGDSMDDGDGFDAAATVAAAAAATAAAASSRADQASWRSAAQSRGDAAPAPAPQAAAGGSGSGSGSGREAAQAQAQAQEQEEAEAALRSPPMEALQSFLEVAREVAATRGLDRPATTCPAGGDTAFDPWGLGSASFVGSLAVPEPPPPAWGSVPRADAAWRDTLGDTEQRVAMLLNTWPELGRLVEPAKELGRQQQQQQQPEAESAAERGGSSSSRSGCGGGAVDGDGDGDGSYRSRMRLHLQAFTDLHFTTLERLYRALKAQAPDARLHAALEAPPLAHEQQQQQQQQQQQTVQEGLGKEQQQQQVQQKQGGAAGGATAAAAAAAELLPPGVLEHHKRSSATLQLLGAVALPHRAAVDMVYTDARGRRVGLCLAHLGASRRSPGEVAVLQHALYGWPKAEVEAAQQGFRAARAAARRAARAVRAARAAAAAEAAAQATAAAEAARAAAAAMQGDAEAAAAAAAITSATMGLLQGLSAAAKATRKLPPRPSAEAAAAEELDHVTAAIAAAEARLHGHAMAAAAPPPPPPTSSPSSRSGVPGQQVGVVSHPLSDLDLDMDPADLAVAAAMTPEEELAALSAAEAAASAMELDAAAVAAAPTIAAAAMAEAAAAAAAGGAAAGALGPTVTASGASSAASASGVRNGSDLDSGSRLDDVIVLELDHDWFHLRESYYSSIMAARKWDDAVRQQIGSAMSYTELPWEAQLDLVWHVLASAGAAPPIRVFA